MALSVDIMSSRLHIFHADALASAPSRNPPPPPPAPRDAVKGLHGTTLHGSVLRIEISANNKNKLGPRGGYRERKELAYDGRASTR